MTGDLKAESANHVNLLRNVPSLSSLDDDILEQVAQVARNKSVRRGESLVNEGDPASSFYIVLKGRFVVLVGEKPIAEIAMGEPIGELAFFAGGKRTATVTAARNSTVLELTKNAYEVLAKRTPEISSGVIRELSNRLAKSIPDHKALRPKAGKICAVFPGGAGPLAPEFVAKLTSAFDDIPGWVVIDGSSFPGSSNDETAMTSWLEQQELHHGNLVLLCRDPNAETTWRHVSAQNADTVFIALDRSNDRTENISPSPLEIELMDATLRKSLQLVLYRADTASTTRNTAPWLADRNVGLHHHVALDSQKDFDRLARFIRGKALGLVMCGGGSFGTAHLGAIQALQERGFEFDFIGGTSVGSAMGAALSIGLTPNEVMDLCEDIFIKSKAMSRLTVPKHSLLDHHVLDAALKHHYRDYMIEDVPINFYANATSLTHNDVCVLRRGPLWEAVRASSSLPGFFPPFIRADGEVLIDGGLLDNAPVSAMRDLKAGPNLVLNFLEPKAWRVRADYSDLPTRAKTLTSMLKRRVKGKPYHPTLMSTLTRAMVVNARKLMGSIEMGDDVLMNVSTLRGMSYLDWKRGRELFQSAHSQVSTALDASLDSDDLDELGPLRAAANTVNGQGLVELN